MKLTKLVKFEIEVGDDYVHTAEHTNEIRKRLHRVFDHLNAVLRMIDKNIKIVEGESNG